MNVLGIGSGLLTDAAVDGLVDVAAEVCRVLPDGVTSAVALAVPDPDAVVSADVVVEP
ncbi:MAG: hypothetical protein IPH03_10025 [Tetrasphaera sp.]|nr:hypothetical protein [Tetrasphaera sp.]